jgi:hypothetical protein
MSPAIPAAYADDPLLDGLLALSGRQSPTTPLPARPAAAELLAKNGIAFVMLNRELASPELLEYVELQMPLTLVASEGVRTLYAVAPRVAGLLPQPPSLKVLASHAEGAGVSR